MPDPVVTPHQNTAGQAAQAAEAATRAQGKQAPIPGGEFDSTVGPGDGSPQDPGGSPIITAATPDAPAERAPPVIKSPFDDKRASITARFRSERTTPETDEISDFTQSGGMPEDFRQASGANPLAPENPDDADTSGDASVASVEGTPQGTPQPQPQTFKVKINGQERELSLEEMTKHAQIALASDGILDTAKAKLKEINELETAVRARASAQPGHQAGQGAQPAEPSQPEPAAPNQDEQIKALIEAIQFGDPEQAATLLRDTIASSAPKPEQVRQEVQQALVGERMRDDGARTVKVLETFKKDHPEFATDPLAQAALERKMYDLQAEDLRKLGLDPDALVEGRPTTPADIASAHKWYRANGMQVRPPDVLLTTAATAVSEWRGVKQATPADPNADPQRGAPRIVVNRDARREAIQQQPSRSAAPRQAPQPAAQPRDRSAIVAAEKARRAGLRGQVLGV